MTTCQLYTQLPVWISGRKGPINIGSQVSFIGVLVRNMLEMSKLATLSPHGDTWAPAAVVLPTWSDGCGGVFLVFAALHTMLFCI